MNEKKKILKIFLQFEPSSTFNEEFIKFVEEILFDWQKDKNKKNEKDRSNINKFVVTSKFT
jgi:hypothetical protein